MPKTPVCLISELGRNSRGFARMIHFEGGRIQIRSIGISPTKFVEPCQRVRRNLCRSAAFIRLSTIFRSAQMNWDRIEGNWKQFKGKAKEQWGKLTDDDLDVVCGQARPARRAAFRSATASPRTTPSGRSTNGPSATTSTGAKSPEPSRALRKDERPGQRLRPSRSVSADLSRVRLRCAAAAAALARAALRRRVDERPDARLDCRAVGAGAWRMLRRALRASRARCSGVVPQQPPTMRAPASIASRA